MAHPYEGVTIANTALVKECTIGKDTKVWNFANVYGSRTHIGERCTIGSYTEIQDDVSIGNDVTICSHSFLCSLVKVEDDVFIGHGVMTVNDLHPPSKKRTGSDAAWRPTYIGRGAIVGTNATLMPVRIGEYAVVAAGAVVTKDVAPYTVVAGNPAKPIGMRKPTSLPHNAPPRPEEP